MYKVYKTCNGENVNEYDYKRVTYNVTIIKTIISTQFLLKICGISGIVLSKVGKVVHKIYKIFILMDPAFFKQELVGLSGKLKLGFAKF